MVKQLQLLNIVFDVFVRCVFFLFSLKIQVEKTQSIIYLRVMIQVFRKKGALHFATIVNSFFH